MNQIMTVKAGDLLDNAGEYTEKARVILESIVMEYGYGKDAQPSVSSMSKEALTRSFAGDPVASHTYDWLQQYRIIFVNLDIVFEYLIQADEAVNACIEATNVNLAEDLKPEDGEDPQTFKLRTLRDALNHSPAVRQWLHQFDVQEVNATMAAAGGEA